MYLETGYKLKTLNLIKPEKFAKQLKFQKKFSFTTNRKKKNGDTKKVL